MSRSQEQSTGFEGNQIEAEKVGEPSKTLVEMLEEVKAEEVSGEGKEEMSKVIGKIQEEYREKMEATKDLPRKKKRILILECSGSVGLGPLMVISDERLNVSNTDMVDVATKIEDLPDSLENVAGVVITGSGANIEDKSKPGFEWIQKTEDFVQKARQAKIPVFGVCFGIQMQADIQGREVPQNEGGREAGVWKTAIYRDEKMPQHPIFKGIEFQKDPKSDKESAMIETLGSHGFRAGYGKDEKTQLYGLHYTDQGHAYPMIEISDEGRSVGLQFHPECSSRLGIDLLEAISKVRYQILKDAGKNPDKIYEELREYRKNNNLKDNTNLIFWKNFIDWAFSESKEK